MRVDLPEGEYGGVSVERFIVTENDRIRQLGDILRGRECPPGTYTRLMERGRVWMSDTPAEIRDHIGPWVEARQRGGRVLVNGLGLGCIVNALLALDSVEHIDVVEYDHRVIKLVAPTYEASGRVTVHYADAYEQCKAWPKGSHWDIAWHDIWPTLCEDNLPEMARLHRSYGRRVGWQGSWGKELLEYERRRTMDAWWR